MVQNPTGKDIAISNMLEAMGDHEFYCSTYASKEAPHIEGLLTTLAQGLDSKLRDIALAKEAGEDIGAHEVVRRVLHRLVSSTNRRMHKGFPEMLTYLLRKPMAYSSHHFVHLSVDTIFRGALSRFYEHLGQGEKAAGSHEGD